MSKTRDYLSRRVGTLRTNAAAAGNEAKRMARQEASLLAELAEAEAALAAVDGLTEAPECPICGSTKPGGTPSCDCEAHRDAPTETITDTEETDTDD